MAAADGPRPAPLRINNVKHQGELGKFRANSESIGWQGETSGRTVVHPAPSVRRAEWFEGQLRVLCDIGGTTEVLSLDGFQNSDYDGLWRYFEQNCGVYVKKHKAIACLSEGDFDGAMRGIEDAADRVDEAPSGSVQKKAREADLLKKAESIRDGLDQAVSGDKQALSRVFSANGCERIGRLRLVIDTVQLEVYRRDPRWLHLRNMSATIEAVLKELGTFRTWRPTEDTEHSSMMRRMMVRELRKRQGGEEEEEEVEEVPVAPVGRSAAHPLYGGEPPLPGVGAEGLLAQLGMAGRGPPPAVVAPPPEEPPAVAEPEDDAGSNAGDEGEDDAYVDEEVTNPNAVRASAPDDRRYGEEGEGGRKLRQTHPGSLLEGWVWKRSRFLRRWRRRWLVLMPDRLMSFAQRGSLKATETVHAGTVFRVYSADGEVQQSKCFCVVVSKRSYYMVCDAEAQKKEWMEHISKSLGTTR